VGGKIDGDGDVEMGSRERSMVPKVEGEVAVEPEMTEEERELLFRCIRCKRGVHVSCLPLSSVLCRTFADLVMFALIAAVSSSFVFLLLLRSRINSFPSLIFPALTIP
jgi:hypothetical protein